MAQRTLHRKESLFESVSAQTRVNDSANAAH
jgi:hypothetical protein